jgi:hypothetical protein
MLYVIMPSFLRQNAHYAECHYAECRYAKCRGADVPYHNSGHEFKSKVLFSKALLP